MKQRILQEEKVYVKQNLNNKQIDIMNIQEMIVQDDQNLADKIIRYGEDL